MNMDRKKFLSMCEECSRLPKGAMGIPVHVPEHLIVRHDGIPYYPVSYSLGWDDGNIVHTAVLHDIRQNSVTSVNLLQLEDENE